MGARVPSLPVSRPGEPTLSVPRVGRSRGPVYRYRHLLFLAALMVAWYVAAGVIANESKLPSPRGVAADLWPFLNSGDLPSNIAASLYRVFVGYGIAVLLGIPLGMWLAMNKRAQRALDPPLQMLRFVPPLALLPILMVLVGVGDRLAFIIVWKAAFFPILINTYAGVREAERVHVEAARTLGAPPNEIMRRILLPAALPGIFTGLRLGIQLAWMSIVAAELIGAPNGLGFMIVYYKQFLLMSRVLSGMLLIGLLGFILDRALVFLRRRIVVWQPV